jgi:hypothetical protein
MLGWAGRICPVHSVYIGGTIRPPPFVAFGDNNKRWNE